LSDTIRPTATVLWGDRFRIQLGLIAEKAYGSDPGFDRVDPWIQLMWQPVQSLSVVFGDLDVPHYYLPALFYPNNYFEQNASRFLPAIPQLKSVPSNYFTQFTHEDGAQVIVKKPNRYEDLFFNYEMQDTTEHNEKFALGFVHRNNWKWLYLNYQAHWLHYGGQNSQHPVETRNDVAQALGLEGEFHPLHTDSATLGAGYTYLLSHLRQEGIDPDHTIPSTNGHGSLFQVFARWGRLKVIGGSWHGDGYYHEGGDPMFILPTLGLATVRWDILVSRDFNLFAETTGYYIGNNDLGYGHYAKAAFHIQTAWQFSIPIVEWTAPTASPERLTPAPIKSILKANTDDSLSRGTRRRPAGNL
jgi:hypothetical protein